MRGAIVEDWFQLIGEEACYEAVQCDSSGSVRRSARVPEAETQVATRLCPSADYREYRQARSVSQSFPLVLARVVQHRRDLGIKTRRLARPTNVQRDNVMLDRLGITGSRGT